MKIKLEFSKNNMEAYVEIVSEEDGVLEKEYLEKKVILDFLRDQGVTYGIRENLPDVFKIGQRYLVAVGKSPIPGKDAIIELLHNTDREIKPKILEDGRVDYRELDTTVIVKKGEVILRRKPPTGGSPGISVKGEIVPSRPGREVPLPIGLNVEISKDDPNILVSKIDGQLIEEDEKISVFPVYEVKGNLDFSVGNVSFPGNVIIRRNVKPGFKIEAKGKVEVYESAEECDIISEGDIIIRKSFIGKNRSLLKSDGSITVGFIDGAKAFAKKDIISHSAIMHSNISAGESVIVEGKGIITGGEIQAEKGIVARIVGSKFGTHTVLKIKKPVDTTNKIKNLRESLKEKSKLIQSLDVKIKVFGQDFTFEKLKKSFLRKELKMSPPQEVLVKKLLATYDTLMKEVETIQKEILSLDNLIQKFKNSVIIIKDTVFPGVIIMFDENFYKVRDALRGVKFYLEGNEIKISDA